MFFKHEVAHSLHHVEKSPSKREKVFGSEKFFDHPHMYKFKKGKKSDGEKLKWTHLAKVPYSVKGKKTGPAKKKSIWPKGRSLL